MAQIDFSENVQAALVMCFLSGLSTAIGGLYVLFVKNQSMKLLGHMLSFSSGVMIYISFMDLLPESIAQIGFINANVWFFAGIAFFAVILNFLPEHDDHDHDHDHKEEKVKSTKKNENIENNNKENNQEKNIVKNENNQDNQDKKKNNNNNKKKTNTQSKGPIQHKKKEIRDEYLNNLGIVTAIGISLHNFPEGVAVYLSCLKGVSVGLPLMLAIAAHNIPEGMAVAAPVFSATGSKWKAFKYCLYSGLCEPLGAVIFGLLFKEYMTPYLVQSMLAAVAGIMIFMVIRELLPASLKYIRVNQAVVSNVFGMFFIFLSIYFLHSILPHDHGDAGHGHSHSHDHSHHGHSHGHDHSHHDHSHSKFVHSHDDHSHSAHNSFGNFH